MAEGLDFTNPCSFLVQIKAKDDPQIFYCPRSAIKSFTLTQLQFDDVFEADVAMKDLIIFLTVFNGDIFEGVKKLNVQEQQQLIRAAHACGISVEGHEFDSFPVLSDAIFDGDPQIDWIVWSIVAKYYGLDMYKPEDATELVGRRGQACWLDLHLRERGITDPRRDMRETELVGMQIMQEKFRHRKLVPVSGKGKEEAQ